MGGALIGRQKRRTSKPTYVAAVQPVRPKVAFVCPCVLRGGAERWMIGLARYCQDCDFTGVLITPNGPSNSLTCEELSRHMPIHTHGSDQFENDNSYVQRHSTWQQAFDAACSKADILVVWGIENHLADINPSSIPSIVVLASHGSCQWTTNWLVRNQRYATHFAAVSRAARNPYPDALKPSVKVINNGAEIDRCTPLLGRHATRAAWGIPAGVKCVGYLGRFAVEKEPGAVIRAVSHLPSDHWAVFVGCGPLEAPLREACERKIPGRYRFVPFARHVGDALAALDALIIASPHEGFCYAIIESWLARCPVVGTQVGATIEMEEIHGQLTFAIPYQDSGEVIAKQVLAATSPAGRTTVERAFQVAWNHLTAAKMGHDWNEWFNV